MARVKQGHLEGLEPPSIEEIDGAAAEYVKVRDRRMKLTTDETEKKAILLELMHKHKLKTYDAPDVGQVVIVPSENVKVRKTGAEENGEDEEPSVTEMGRRHLEGRSPR